MATSSSYFRERRKTQCVKGSVLQWRAEGFIVELRVVRSHVGKSCSFCALTMPLVEEDQSSPRLLPFLESTGTLMSAGGGILRRRGAVSLCVRHATFKRRGGALLSSQARVKFLEE